MRRHIDPKAGVGLPRLAMYSDRERPAAAFVLVAHQHLPEHAQIGLALEALTASPRIRHRRQQKTDADRDDPQHDEQLEHREATSRLRWSVQLALHSGSISKFSVAVVNDCVVGAAGAV